MVVSILQSVIITSQAKTNVGWHSDDFPQIDIKTCIASLSLGSTRKFKLQHKEDGETVDSQLESGSLLIMLPGYQEY